MVLIKKPNIFVWLYLLTCSLYIILKVFVFLLKEPFRTVQQIQIKLGTQPTQWYTYLKTIKVYYDTASQSMFGLVKFQPLICWLSKQFYPKNRF